MKTLLAGLVLLALIAALAVSFVMSRAGQWKTLEPVGLPGCRAVDGAPGAEDITVDRRSGTAFVSSFDRRAAQAGAARQGGIFSYDLGAPGAAPRLLTAGFSGELHPHGISFWSGDEGAFLHVVNHAPSGHAVEIFEWRDGGLTHRETVRGDLLMSPNDVLAVGPRRFYVTNDHGHSTGLDRMLEEYLQRAESNVAYFDGAAWSVAADGIAYANGINLSHDGGKLYVAGTTRGRLHVYARDASTGALDPIEVIELGTGVDNIEVDRHGMLWLGAHPKLLSFVAHAGDPAERSPSEVLWVDPVQALDPPVRTVFLSLGDDLSGSSVAVVFGSRILVGSVFEPHFLDCEADPRATRGLPERPPVTRMPAP